MSLTDPNQPVPQIAPLLAVNEPANHDFKITYWMN